MTKRIAGTIGQTLILLIIAAGVALGVNALRIPGEHIEISHPYIVPLPKPPPPPGPTQPVTSSSGPTTSQKGPTTAAYPEVKLEEMKALLNDPRVDTQILIVDARRGTDDYEAGHIPNAKHFDHFNPGPAVERGVITLAQQAASQPGGKIIIYCNGGECDDSQYVREDFIRDFGLPAEKIYIFTGGWEEWTSVKPPLSTVAGQE